MKTDHALSRAEALDLIREAQAKPVLTFFLSYEDQALLAGMMPARLAIHAAEHYPGESRKRLVISRADLAETSLPPEGVALLAVSFPAKSSSFAPVTHRDILGSLMGLGVKRATIGDIVVDDGIAHVFVTEDMAPYLMASWRSVGRLGVQPTRSELAHGASLKAPEATKDQLTVSSLRLDNLVSHGLGLSKAAAQEAIQEGRIKVNGAVDKKTDRILKVGDVLSITGYGRITLTGLLGTTRKDHIRLEIERMH